MHGMLMDFDSLTSFCQFCEKIIGSVDWL